MGALICVAACSSNDAEPTRTFDAAAPPLPGACVLTKTARPFCEPGDASLPAPDDAGTDASDDASSDAGTDAPATGTVAPPESENRCLLTHDESVSCPSAVAAIVAGAGKDDATELVIAQRGLAHANAQGFVANDVNAYSQYVHIDASGEGTVTADVIAPYPGEIESGGLPERVALVPSSAGRDASLLVLGAADANGRSQLSSGVLAPGRPAALGPGMTVDASFLVRTFASASGEGFVALQGGASSPVTLVRGLPDAPRSVRSAVSPIMFVAGTEPSGEPAGLFYDGASISLLEGEAFDRPRWSRPFAPRSGSGGLDLAWVTLAEGAVPAVLVDDGEQPLVELLRAGAPDPLPGATVGKSFSTCPRSTYIGVTCDACPTSKQCETGEDRMISYRMFSDGARLFVVYVATDVRHTMGYSLDTTPIIGAGCVCSLVTRDTREYADSLVLVEIVPGEKASDAPTVVERMRVPMFAAHATGFASLVPREKGAVDVVVGAPTHGFSGTLVEWPKDPQTYRVLRVSTAGLP